MQEYNGYTNYQTWNVALWIQNDIGLYRLAQIATNYKEFKNLVPYYYTKTPDGVSLTDSSLNIDELDRVFNELDSVVEGE